MKNENMEHLKEADEKLRNAIEKISRDNAIRYNLEYDDIYQEAWIEYLEFIEQFWKTGILRIRDRIANYRKKNLRENSKTVHMTDMLAQNPGFDMPGNDHSYGERAKLILSVLPDRDREIMEMYFVGSYTQQEIADKFNLSKPRINQIIENSLKKVKKITIST